MAMGLCCQWLEPDKKGRPKNVLVSRNLQLGRFNRGEYSRDRIKKTYVDNLKNLLEVMPKVIESGICNMRISSTIFPLSDKVDQELSDNDDTRDLLQKIGKLALDNGVRCTTHPGQFTVLSSDNEDTVANAIKEMDHHAWMFDCMGFPKTPYYSINVHGGKGGRMQQLIAGISQLSMSARARITLENCEFAYSVRDLEPIAREIGVPICFDSHHHRFNTGGLGGEEAMEIAISTWPRGSKPLTHISNSKPEYSPKDPPTKLRQHSDYLYYIPDYQLKAHNEGRIDMDIEAKMKNLAIFKAVDDLGIKL